MAQKMKFKMDMVKLLEAMSDAKLYSYNEIQRRCGVSAYTITNAFKNQEGRVEVLTAERIARALGCDMQTFGKLIVHTYENPGCSIAKPADYKPVKKQKPQLEKTQEPAQNHEPEQKPEMDGAPNSQLLNQLIFREMKLQTELLKRLVEAWEK